MKTFFHPQSVALIGVSRQTGPGAYNGLEMMLRYGYQGRIYVIHPQAEEILGFRAYPQVQALPEVPELAVIAVGRDRVLPVVEDCQEKGVRRLIIISQGFADADDTGRDLQTRLTALAREKRAKIVGPNTMGVLNAFVGFSTAFVDIKRPPEPPPVALVAQSGAPQVGSESFTGPLGKAIDLGNAADVSFVEVLEYLEHDPQTQVIVLHIEGLRQGRPFLEVAARINRRKPIIVLKTGHSAAGAQAALSHTGSLVGEDAVFEAACQQAGLVRVPEAREMVDAVQAFRKLPVLPGPRIGIATPSGALGIMALDALSQAGLEAGPLPAAIRQQVEPQGPYWHKLHNPVDLWPIGMKTGDYLQVAAATITGFLADPHIDGVMCMLPALSSPLHRNIVSTAAFIRALDLPRYGKPLTVSLYGDYREHIKQELDPVPGVAAYFSVEQAARALGRLYAYHRAVSQPATFMAAIEGDRPGGSKDPKPRQNCLLVGQEALEFLASYRIPVITGTLTQSAAEAAAAAEAAGYPVVLKVVSPQWLHKSDRGGVLLNLNTAREVRRGFTLLSQRVARETPGASLTGILVQKQLQGRELLLGIKQDPTFGPVVVCGFGGIYTELWQDVAQTLAPLTADQAREMLASLKSYPLLTGFRGEPPVALEPVVQALVQLSRLALDQPWLQELDLNPLLAAPQGCWAVDARLVFGVQG